ncbi:MAG TPA: hypothetical protein VE650_19520 [Acetobacteraceae bacterium]|nr:hypothetical protein [Acetobacteraceae bacterium]
MSRLSSPRKRGIGVFSFVALLLGSLALSRGAVPAEARAAR